MEILKVIPSFSERIWGGNELKKYGFDIDESKSIGEAWVISAHDNGMGFIKQEDKLISLKDFFAKNRSCFGNFAGEYPLLVKIITPNDYLSVQVHPDDKYALTNHNSLGKPESWYVMDCPKNAHLIYGHTASTKEDFLKRVENSEWDDLLKKVEVKVGDFLYVPPGKIHAITPGVVVYELQRSSDITYRLYDYDRVDKASGLPRELHIKESLDNVAIPDDDGLIVRNAKDMILSSEFFSCYKINSKDITNWVCPENAGWLQLTILKGQGKINGMDFKMGESAICIDKLESLIVEGNMEVIVSWVVKTEDQ